MSAPYYQDDLVTLHHGTAASVAPEIEPASVRTIVTSPPYFGLRDYGHDDQIGAESSVDEYVDSLVATFAALRPALADDGTLWLNLGDSYARGFGGGTPGRKSATNAGSFQGRSAGKKSIAGSGKNLLGVPWRVAFALQSDGWILRSDVIWAKPNPMPESVTDRPTKAHEYLFLLAKQPRYYYDAEAIREPAETDGRPLSSWDVRKSSEPIRRGDPAQSGHVTTTATLSSRSGRNKRDIWEVATAPFSGGHFATYPPELIRPCILAGSARGDTVLDPFSGSGTTGMVATQEGRRYVGIDVNADYLDLSLRERFSDAVLDMTGGAA